MNLFFSGTQGAILVYDVCNRESFRQLDRLYSNRNRIVKMMKTFFFKRFSWLSELDTFSTKVGIIKMLVGNKIDREKDREISRDEGVRFAKKHSMLFIEASARTCEGVQIAFEELVQKVKSQPMLNFPSGLDDFR